MGSGRRKGDSRDAAITTRSVVVTVPHPALGLRARACACAVATAALSAAASHFAGAAGVAVVGAVGAAAAWFALSPLARVCSAVAEYAVDGGGVPHVPVSEGANETAVLSAALARLTSDAHENARIVIERKEFDDYIGVTLRILDSLADPVFWCKHDGTVAWANLSAERELGVTRDAPAPAWSTREAGKGTVPIGKGKASRHYDVSLTDVEARGVSVRACVARDVSSHTREKEEWREQATTDRLTGLKNRASFAEDMDAMCQAGEEFHLLFVDLDKFKPVNDTHGHAAGDDLLRKVSERMLESGGMPYRLGGDEFAVIVPGGREEARECASQLLKSCSLPFGLEFEGKSVKVKIGCSIGAAAYPDDGYDQESLSGSADKALYASKEAGRNTLTFASSPTKGGGSALGLPTISMAGTGVRK